MERTTQKYTQQNKGDVGPDVGTDEGSGAIAGAHGCSKAIRVRVADLRVQVYREVKLMNEMRV